MKFLLLFFPCLLLPQLVYGQIGCFCSGVTSNCSEASLYWSTLRVPVRGDDSGFGLTDRDASTWLGKNKPVFNWDTYELSYKYNPGDRTVFYWSLPEEFLGSKLGAYGGNMTVVQRGVGSGEPVQDSSVIMTGNGLTVHYGLGGGTDEDEKEENTRVLLKEDGWFTLKNGVPLPATREEFMKVLSNIKVIHVRASTKKEMEELMIQKAMMDISVPQNTGGPPASGVEECECPEGYSGLSCEECDDGYYRDKEDDSEGDLGACKPCPCNDNQDSCEQDDEGGEVVCVCKEGWTGLGCDTEGDPDDFLDPQNSTDPEYLDSQEYSDPEDYSSPLDYQDSDLYPDILTPQEDPNLTPDPRGNLGSTAYPESQNPPNSQRYPDSGANPSNQANPGSRGNPYSRAQPTSQPYPGSRDNPYSRAQPNNQAYPGSRDNLNSRAQPTSQAYPGSRDNPYSRAQPTSQAYPGSRENPSAQPDTRTESSSDPIEVKIYGPRVQSVRPGETVTFDCSARPKIRIEDPLNFAWTKENGDLPPGRSTDSGYGILIITSVETDDSGTYVCTVTAGAFRVQERLQLQVEAYDPMQVQNNARSGYAEVRQSQTMNHPLPQRYPSRRHYSQDGLYHPPTQRTPYAAQPRYDPPEVCPPVTVTIEPHEQTIPQGSSTELKCIGSGSSVISWEKVGEDLSSPSLTVAGSVITVSSAYVSDRGMYVCTATSSCGSGRASSILEVEPREIPTVEMYPSEYQTVTKGESVLFQCRYMSGIPTPMISWGRDDGRPMPPNAELLSGGVLRMDSVTGAEAGQFRCRAENAAGRVEAMATLRIQEHPRIRMEPQGSVTVMEGSPLVIKCLATGDPTPVVSWKRMGISFTELDTVSPTLEIARVTKQDEGTYSCVATNAAGQEEDRVQVIVEEQPKPTETPQRQYQPKANDRYPVDPYHRYPPQSDIRHRAETYHQHSVKSGQPSVIIPVQAVEHEVNTRVGMNVDLTCMNVGSMPHNTRVVWSRSDGSTIASSHTTGQGVLHIRSAKKSDEGVYLCQLIEDGGAVLFQLFANLRVQDRQYYGIAPADWDRPPMIQPPPRYPDEQRPTGCPDGNWRCRAGDCVPEAAICDGHNDCQDGTDELDCPDVRPTQDFLPPPSSPPPPVGGNSIQLSISGPTDRVVPMGQTVQFLCQAVPTQELGELLTLQWVRENDEDLPPGRCEDDGEGGLQIREVQPVDSGVYICVAIAGRFINTAQATLAVEDRPQSPSKGYQPPEKGYQPPVRQQPDKGYQPPSYPPQDQFDTSIYPPVGSSGVASNIRNLEYDDENDDNAYDDYAYDYNYGQRPSPIPGPENPSQAEPYSSPYNPYSRRLGQRGQVG